MLIARLFRLSLTCSAGLLLLAACGGRDTGEDGADPSAEAAAEAEAVEEGGSAPAGQAPATDPSTTAAPLAAADIDRWQKGMASELEAVRSAAAKLQNARSSEDTLSAIMAVQEMATIEAGAKGAGVDLERYKTIRSDLSAAAAYMTPELGGIDTTMLSPEQRAELRQMNEAQLKQLEARVPPEVIEALRPRAAELRKQELELVGARLKGAGMVR